MKRSYRRSLLAASITFGLAWGSGIPPDSAAAGTRSKLSEFDFLLLGLSLRPDPEVQVVPRNTPTGIRIALGVSDSSADVTALLPLLPAGLEIAAELVGPGITSPIALRAPPGELLPIPALVERGLYLVRDIRLEGEGGVFLRASPDSATVEVIDRVLITQVTTRPLTLEEIRQKGILFGDGDFTGFNFTLALKLDSRPVIVEFPVLFDQNEVPVMDPTSRSLQIRGASLPGLANTSIVPVMLKPQIDATKLPEVGSQLSELSIPGLLVFPGDVGFLNQFFSAILLVSNGAPSGSGLRIANLSARIELPAGEDRIPDTEDDPLEVAETSSGGRPLVLPLLRPGAACEPWCSSNRDASGASRDAS